MIPTPKNLNWWWIWGIVLAFCLVLQIITGIILVMHYTPHVDMAFASIEHIMRDVNGGHMLRYIHANGASLFFIAVYNPYVPRSVLWFVQSTTRSDMDHRHDDLPCDDGNGLSRLRAAMGSNVLLGRNRDYWLVWCDPVYWRKPANVAAGWTCG